ncbi:MAG TPA: hypothetical protein DCQ78_00835, partial [Ruminococcus sp.]|nr:hypothetical protein [Ruminococcus sp.]
NLYGGDASALKDVITQASEINENYVFNGGSSKPDVPTTTETTTTTTETTTTTTTVSSDTTTVLKGDVNFDNSVDIADVVAISAYVANSSGNPLSQEAVSAGDVHNTGDGLNANDALKLQQFLAGIINEL